jgi:transposase InsO family protein
MRRCLLHHIYERQAILESIIYELSWRCLHGKILPGDTKRFPLLQGKKPLERREYLFVAIDDFSRELYAALLSDNTQTSSKAFLEKVRKECPYTIEQYHTDNGKEYRADPKHHAFMTPEEKLIEYYYSETLKQRPTFAHLIQFMVHLIPQH